MSRSSTVRRAIVCGGVAACGSQALHLYRQPSWRPAAFHQAQSIDANHPDIPGRVQKNTAIVIGAGVAGICSAYQLTKRGYEVLVLDTLEGAAAGGSSSAAAAGGMDIAHKFSTSAEWRKMFGQLLPIGDSFRFFYISWLDVIGDVFYWRWLARFASESLFATAAHIEKKNSSFLPLVEWGIEQTVKTMVEVPGLLAASHFSDAGSVMSVSSGGGYTWKGSSDTVSLEEVQAFEPLIAGDPDARFRMKPRTRFGECCSFTQHLAAHCESKLPVRIIKNTAVHGFSVQNDHVVGIKTSRGFIDVGEAPVVLCAGAWSGILCDMLGVFCPIYPLKGYCFIVDLEGSQGLTRLTYNTATYAVPAGPNLRVASIGGLGGWDSSVDPGIEAAVKAEAVKLVPSLTEKIRKARTIAGFRPFSADEMPLIGRIPRFSNVFLNAGPGHTGWKAAAGFAEILAASVCGEERETIPGAELLDPAGRLGVAVTGPRLLREVQAFFA
eukprot:TRINITY_DN54849_c0_g1_i1.p1 TRINITY_DN54849_c0_g1~~TRINITY_DN54849_c0_g1_i1.p1  ORF type:complete len:495 (+),score=66.06 TRINITY_DN54849_c0_g1_i1:99-1583(+)